MAINPHAHDPAARFAVGDRVRMTAAPAPRHTRLPGDARGRCGSVQAWHGAHVFPDAHADVPVFAEPGQAHAFAMTLALHERGLFGWPEWARTLAAEEPARARRLGACRRAPAASLLDRTAPRRFVAGASELRPCDDRAPQRQERRA